VPPPSAREEPGSPPSGERTPEPGLVPLPDIHKE
jgi:hypothetical protein